MKSYQKEYYDTCFANSDMYKKHYRELCYYPMWEFIIKSIEQNTKVLELGCGCGHFANMLKDSCTNIHSYIGVDFSSVGISICKSKATDYVFIESDIMNLDYSKYKDHLIISTETFEHLDNDISLLSKIHGNEIIFSIPNFYDADGSHVRVYPNEKMIRDYYKDILSIRTIKQFFLGGNYFHVIIAKIIHHDIQ